MSDTPMTDAVEYQVGSSNHTAVHASHARQLERKLTEVTKQRDALIEGLEKLASCDWVITLPDRMDAVREIARDTLNKIQP